MTTEPEPAPAELGPDDLPLSVEEQLRRRVSVLIELSGGRAHQHGAKAPASC